MKPKLDFETAILYTPGKCSLTPLKWPVEISSGLKLLPYSIRRFFS
jgi:hypothetical protein